MCAISVIYVWVRVCVCKARNGKLRIHNELLIRVIRDIRSMLNRALCNNKNVNNTTMMGKPTHMPPIEFAVHCHLKAVEDKRCSW